MHELHTAVWSLGWCVAFWTDCYAANRLLQTENGGTLNQAGLMLACQISFFLGALMFLIGVSFGVSCLLMPS